MEDMRGTEHALGDDGPLSVFTHAHSLSQLPQIAMRFAHDKLQAAAYRLIPPSALSSLHATIAAQLLASCEGEAANEWAMEIVSHVNTGFLDISGSPTQTSQSLAERAANAAGKQVSSKVRISSPQTHEEWTKLFRTPGLLTRVIELELIGGCQAKMASAYDSAIRLFSAALTLLQMQERMAQQAEGGGPALNSAEAAIDPLLCADLVLVPSTASSGGTLGSSTLVPGAAKFVRVCSGCWRRQYSTCMRLYVELSQCLFSPPNM